MSVLKGCLPSHVVPNRIKNWFVAEKVDYVQNIGESARNTLFSFVVTLSSGTKVDVVQSSGRIDSFCVSAALSFTGSQIEKLSKSKKKREDVLSGLRLKLAALDVEISFVQEKVVFNHTIYYDALTKDRLFKAISTVDKVYTLARWILKTI